MRILLSFAIILIASLSVAAQTFDDAIHSYQTKDLETAKNLFQKVISENPNSISAWFNLGLIASEQKLTGLALANWRQCLEIDSNYQPARQAINFQLYQAKLTQPFNSLGLIEEFQLNTLRHVDTWIPWVLVSLLGIIVGFPLIGFFAAYQKAIDEDLPSPQAPWSRVSYLLIVLLFSVSLCVGILKSLDTKIGFATVLKNEKLSSAPSGVGADLTELREGHEVIVYQLDGDYAQVSIPGGTLGWLPKAALFIYTRSN